MSELLHISSAPHDRGSLSTKAVMRDVLLALLPTTVLGVWAHGWYSALIILLSITSAVLTEYVFDRVTKRPNTVTDGSAILTGLLLALTLPANVPVYIPVLGAVFAILVVKCLFGGLGHNFMNPALAGRSFLLISFGTAMTGYTLDGVSAATPLAELASGKTIDMLALAMGNTSGVIGSSALGLIAGGIYLLLSHGITWEIPTATIGSTAIFLMIFGGHGIDPAYLLPQLLGGGLLMAAFFMATDPVTCPSTTKGQLLYGCVTGVLIGLFRVKGASADSTTYAVLLANMFSNIIDELFIPLPFAFRIPKDRKKAIPKPVIILLVITLVAGAALSGVYVLTADRIAENQERAAQAAFLEVVPGAVSFETDEAVQAAAEGSAYGSVTIQKALTGVDESGNVVGYAISVRNAQSFDGGLALVVGIQADGTLNGISFTELHETAGMGMKCGEPDFMNQFAGVNVASFTLNKGGASAEDDVIDSVNGASVTSGSVVDAVNAALDFFAANLK
ncbi:MAG: RnfABCDGE type electron transport complex subunit D [Clostridiales bacterium]|nr:RnfABCDGE type electron transport complex subunit D [Clostridiales bacterium]